jgi:hypothetical protein
MRRRSDDVMGRDRVPDRSQHTSNVAGVRRDLGGLAVDDETDRSTMGRGCCEGRGGGHTDTGEYSTV